MNKNIIFKLLVILFIIFLIIFISQKNIENFSSNQWTTNKEQLAAENASLTDNQKTEVKNMINSITKSELKNLITTQSPLLTGPQGRQGVQGPPGTKLVASGRLINKKGSFDNDENFMNPKYVVTRTEGTNPTSSLSYMSNLSPFGSFQNWHLDINSHLKNRFDGNCLTMSPNQDKLYMDKCNDESEYQKWNWDKSNRLISGASTDNNLKCVGLSRPEKNVLTTNIPGCSGQNCVSNTAKQFLVIKDCDVNNINEDELWDFM